MTISGYFLLICQCDKCGDEQVFRGLDKHDAWQRAVKRNWKQVDGKALCIRCAPAVVCKFCRGQGCLACQGEKQRALKKSRMKVLK